MTPPPLLRLYSAQLDCIPIADADDDNNSIIVLVTKKSERTRTKSDLVALIIIIVVITDVHSGIWFNKCNSSR